MECNKLRFSKNHVPVHVRLDSEYLFWRAIKKEKAGPWQGKQKISDLVGVTVWPPPATGYFTAHFVPHPTKNVFSSDLDLTARKQSDLLFYSDDPSELEIWTSALVSEAFKIPREVGLPQRNVVFLANPFSGTGKGLELFTQEVYPILLRGHIVPTVIKTKRAGHARDLARTMDLTGIDGVVCCSGDGLLAEVLNGIMERSDWERAVQVPLGVIPAGSGNGLARSLEIRNAVDAAVVVARGMYRPMDVFSAVQEGHKRTYCFLSVTWGFMADVDVGTDDMRWMGDSRFTVGVLRGIAKRTKYRARLRMLLDTAIKPLQGKPDAAQPEVLHSPSPSPDSHSEPTTNNNDSGGASSADQTSKFAKCSPTCAACSPPQSSFHGLAVSTRMQQEEGEGGSNPSSGPATGLLTSRTSQQLSPKKQEKIRKDPHAFILSAMSQKSKSLLTVDDLPTVNQPTSTAESQPQPQTETSGSSSDQLESPDPPQTTPAPERPQGPLCQHIGQQHQSYEGWMTIEDDFSVLMACNVAWISGDANMAPLAHMNDGCLDVVVVRSKADRSDMLSIFLSLENGSHLKNPAIEYYKAKALVIEPLSPGSWMVLDGESVDVSPVETEVHRGLIKMMCY